MHSQLAQAHQRRLIFDALSYGRLAELPGDADDPPDEPLVGLAVGQVAYELDVDLQKLRWDLFEIAQAGKTGSEVVERQPAAKRGDLSGEPAASVELGQTIADRPVIGSVTLT